jgi:glucose-6-phosphate 1-dehydrogenase
MALRFANGLFEPMWNREHIDHVQITAAETVGVEQRGKFYEKTGALRDMVPKSRISTTGTDGDGTADLLRCRCGAGEEGGSDSGHTSTRSCARRSARANTMPAPFWARPSGRIGKEPDVAPDSNTETYIACKLQIDNWRWAGVPVLPAYRQIPEAASNRDSNPCPPGAVYSFPRHRRRANASQLDDSSHSTR